MQKLYDIKIQGTNIIDQQPLFAEGDEREKEIAEKILRQLAGTTILTAQLILKKCEIALLQSTVDLDLS